MYVPLPSSWAAFQKVLSAKLGKKARRIERKHGEFRLANAETLRADLEALFELHQRRWNERGAPGAFHSTAVREFHREVARDLLSAGILRLHVLSLDGKPGVISCNFQKGAICYGHVWGFDMSSKLSLGTVLAGRTIRHAIEADKAVEFDMCGGNYAYKYRLGAQERRTQRISMTHPGMRSAAPAHAVQMAHHLLLRGFRGAGIHPRWLAYQLRSSLSPTSWIRSRSSGAQSENATADM